MRYGSRGTIGAWCVMVAAVAMTAVCVEVKAETCFTIGGVRAVDSDALGGGTCPSGRSWQNAFTDLQEALDVAADPATDPPVTEIWVAVHDGYGYFPTKPVPEDPYGEPIRRVTFRMADGLALYGGFQGYELDRSHRNPELNLTVLTGELPAQEARPSCPPYDDNCPYLNPDADCFEPYGGPGCVDAHCCKIVCCQDPLCCVSWDADCVAEAEGLCAYRLNAYHVVTASDVGETAILNGFVIRSGKADGNHFASSNDEVHGGGVLISAGQVDNNTPGPIIARCQLSNGAKEGGGLFSDGDANFAGAIMPRLVNVEFRANYAWMDENDFSGGNGAGAYSGPKSQELWMNCLFANNSAEANGAGLFMQTGTELNITNCTFANNIAEGSGGGIYFLLASQATPVPTVIANSIFWSNTDAGGTDGSAQIHVAGSANVTLTYSDVEDGLPVPFGVTDGGNNMEDDPKFVDPGEANYHLKACSPCIDVGSDDAVADDLADLDEDGDAIEKTPWDLDKNDRFLDSADGGMTATVDMGAYEFVPNPCVWDCQLSPDGGVGVADFLALLQQWGQECTSCDLAGGPGVGIVDFLALLQHWDSCSSTPVGPPQSVQDCMERYNDPLVIAECICAVEPCTEGCPPEGCH